jgi:hypothetical protein
MGVKEQLEVNIYAIENLLTVQLTERQKLLDEIEEGNTIIHDYRKDISKAQGNNKATLEEGLKQTILDKKYLEGKLDSIENEIIKTEVLYHEANIKYAEYLQNGAGIKRKVVKRKVIPTKASRPVKPTVRKPTKRPVKPTKPIARKPTKPTKRPAKPTARKPTIVRRK